MLLALGVTRIGATQTKPILDDFRAEGVEAVAGAAALSVSSLGSMLLPVVERPLEIHGADDH